MFSGGMWSGCLFLSTAGPLSGQTLYSIGEPTDLEQHYVESINRARALPQEEAQRYAETDDPDILGAYEFFEVDLEMMQAQFAEIAPVAPVAINSKLVAAARKHSLDMLTHGFQGHIGMDGSTDVQRVEAEGYIPALIGETVFARGRSVWQGHVAFEVNWFPNDQGGVGGMRVPPIHRQVIHEPGFYEIGVGLKEGTGPNGVGPQVVTHKFSRVSGATPFITGVVYFDVNGNGLYDPGEGVGGVTVTVAEGSFYAETSFSGGYTIPVPGNGVYEVTFSAPGLPEYAASVTVENNRNVKLDYVPAYEPPQVSGPGMLAVDGTNTFEATAVPMATSYRWRTARQAAYTYVEGAEEGTAHVAIQSSPGYEVIQSAVKASGNHAFHLAHPEGFPVAQTMTLERTIVPADTSELAFQSRLGASWTDQVARVYISADDGSSWKLAWSEPGTGTFGQSSFEPRTVSLAPYAGQGIRLRFSYEVQPEGSYYPSVDTNPLYGWVIDDIAVSDAVELKDETITSVNGDSLFTFSPSIAGTYVIQAAADAAGREFPFGPSVNVAAVVTAVAPSIVRHPVDVVVQEGQPMELSVGASGSGTLSYLWQKNGDTIPGKTASSLGIDAVSLSDSGTYMVRVQSDAGTLWSDPAQVTVVPAPTGFQAWKQGHFSDDDLNDPEVSGPTADPGGFGISNLHRYAFGLDPVAPEREELPEIEVKELSGQRHVALTFRRLKDAGDITYIVEGSNDLLMWDPVDMVYEVVNSNSGSGTETVSAREANPVAGAKRFLRVRVEID